ncbi:MAG: hypothetical protein WA777_07750 [Rhodanobacter sp.]
MAQTLSHAMRYVDNINTDHLASALFGVATLVDMGCGCAELAHADGAAQAVRLKRALGERIALR